MVVDQGAEDTSGLVLGGHAGDRGGGRLYPQPGDRVLLGVLLSGIFFAAKIAQLFRVTSDISADGRIRTYRVEGQLFYGSVEDFMNAFDFKEALERVVIDVSGAHIWDISSVQALDMAILKFRRDGAEVEIVGMNAATETIVDRLAIHDKPGAMNKLMAH